MIRTSDNGEASEKMAFDTKKFTIVHENKFVRALLIFIIPVPKHDYICKSDNVRLIRDPEDKIKHITYV